MGLARIDALCQCDGCGERFGVEIEERDLTDFQDMEELVLEEVRGGLAGCYKWGVRGKQTVDRISLSYGATVQGGLLLCDKCSKACDELEIGEDRDLTEAEVRNVLHLHAD